MNIIFLGPQASGKGTQAELLKHKLNIPILTTGGIFRSKKKEESEEGKMVASLIDKGMLVPDELTDKIVREELDKDIYKNGVILDGYPRNENQARALDSYFNVNKVIFLDVPDAIILKRILSRRICESCEAVYNLDTNPPKESDICDKCKGALIQRADDTEEAIAKRLNIYHNLTEPLINYYAKQNKLVRIDGKKSVDGVAADIAVVL